MDGHKVTGGDELADSAKRAGPCGNGNLDGDRPRSRALPGRRAHFTRHPVWPLPSQRRTPVTLENVWSIPVK